MITYNMIHDAQECIIQNWGEQGIRVIEECAKVNPFNDTAKNFLSHCNTCGGDWGGMILSGIWNLWPEVWEMIPDEMGCFAFSTLCNVLVLCGVDTSEEAE